MGDVIGESSTYSNPMRNCLPTGRKTAQLSLSPATLIQCESEPGRPVSPSVIKSVSHPISRGRGHQVLAWLAPFWNALIACRTRKKLGFSLVMHRLLSAFKDRSQSCQPMRFLTRLGW
ncbi:hypothetical protein CDAR_611911 [Caerostris darwini]|uniref:Uncharacterized protein n=1 Tax=Caerostris darwini TaxID=1538125 RepID=A0AAV4MSW0_9ARAC|nr:hypothetical protein CDAR_611911 [Caerostris darwini]